MAPYFLLSEVTLYLSPRRIHDTFSLKRRGTKLQPANASIPILNISLGNGMPGGGPAKHRWYSHVSEICFRKTTQVSGD